MLSAEDNLSICTALQQMSRFTPAELAATSGRRLRLVREFIEASPHLVKQVAAPGHDPKRPLREYFEATGDSLLLHREIEKLRVACCELPPLGNLFEGIDRLIRDVTASESDICLLDCSQEDREAEQALIAAQKRYIDSSLVDVEVSVSTAVRARRLVLRADTARDASSPHTPVSNSWIADWFAREGATLLDWSCEASRIRVGHDLDQGAISALGNRTITDIVAALAGVTTVDDVALGVTLAALQRARQAWRGEISFGEALDAEYRYILRQSFGCRLLAPLAIAAAVLAEPACANSVFEGWVMTRSDFATESGESDVVAAALGRLAFESSHRARGPTGSDKVASMCQYVLSSCTSAMSAVAAAAGGLLRASSKLDHALEAIAGNYGRLRSGLPDDHNRAIVRMVSIALFRHGAMAGTSTPIPSLPELAGGEKLLDVLLNHQNGAVASRSGSMKYELRPGPDILRALESSLGGDENVTLVMPVSREFERQRVIEGTAARWGDSPPAAGSFLDSLEARPLRAWN